jgi:SSS family solute:Na+ symporter
VVADVPKWQGCLIGGVVVTAYFAAGGLLTSAWVNLVQLIVKFAGFLLALPLALQAVGGWGSPTMRAITVAQPLGADYFAMTGIGLRGVLSYAVILIPSFIVSPGLIQKLYGGRSPKAVRIGVNLNAFGLLAFAFVPALLGMIARSRFQLDNPELALPMVMTHLLPPWLGLLALAAVFSAEISACDAILFMLSSSLSIDLYRSVLRPNAADREILLAGRVAAIVGAAMGIAIAIQLPSIISALRLFYGLMSR